MADWMVCAATRMSSKSIKTGITRTRTGCLVCRSRKVKCDEGKPQCENCIKHAAVCIYAPKKVYPYGQAQALPTAPDVVLDHKVVQKSSSPDPFPWALRKTRMSTYHINAAAPPSLLSVIFTDPLQQKFTTHYHTPSQSW